MLNFTGQSKKRVVNLGNRQTGAVNFLEQTRQQREAREQLRQRERAAITLQERVKWYLQLSNVAARIDLHTTSLSVCDEKSLSRYLAEFLFVARWRRSLPEDVVAANVTDMILVLLQYSQLVERLSRFQLERLVGSLVIVGKNDHRHSFTGHALQCLVLVLMHENATQCHFPGVITRLEHLLPVAEYTAVVTDIIFAINVRDDAGAFILFLCSRHLDFCSTEFRKKTLRSTLPRHTDIIQALSPQQKCQLLVNVLAYLPITGRVDSVDYTVLGAVLAAMSFSVRDNSKEDAELESDPSKTSIGVDPESIERIRILYSSQFIKNALEHFTAEKDHLSRWVLHIFSSLLYLIPSEKKKLSMLITINPGSYKWFFCQLRSHPLYQSISQVLHNKDYLDNADVSSLRSSASEAEIADFWKLLCTFEELYSYWLIVSIDTETFSGQKLSLEDVVEFMGFLKGVCLTFIFTGAICDNFEALKGVSISLLNQLCAKNTRLQFLPPGFWDTKGINHNIESLVEVIADTKQHGNDLSDEEVSLVFVAAKPRISNDSLARLEVLAKMPFIIPFKSRVKVFQRLIELDKDKNAPVSFFGPRHTLKADIRREYILEDAFESFSSAGSHLKHTLSVTFFNEYGQEAGIDGGGITKEFLTGVVQEGFLPGGKFALFKETATNNQLYPNDEIFKKLRMNVDVAQQKTKLDYLRFLGAIVGKCLYENVLIDVSFAPFFVSKWSNGAYSKSSINDLRGLDQELFENLLKLNTMSDQELRQLDLNFVAEEQVDGRNFVYDLMPPSGKLIQVDTQNRLNYIYQISNYKLNQSLHSQTRAFVEGLHGMISSAWLTMFDPIELQMLISGGEQDINIDDWKENVEYGGYFDDDLTVVYFWEVIKELTPQERFKLVKFVTSVSRAPLLGFQALSPRFGIRNSGRELDRLPTASTCVNLLKLPDYQDKELIRSKLLYAINMGAGFDLS